MSPGLLHNLVGGVLRYHCWMCLAHLNQVLAENGCRSVWGGKIIDGLGLGFGYSLAEFLDQVGKSRVTIENN